MSKPFKMHTQIRQQEKLLIVALLVLVGLNLALVFAFRAMAANLSKPRIVIQDPKSGLVLPLASSVFTWNQFSAESFIQHFLPQVYVISPVGIPPQSMFVPFIKPSLFDASQKRFETNKAVIESEGICQTLIIQSISFDKKLQIATVSGLISTINKKAERSMKPTTITVVLAETSDPLNPYGHIIHELR